MDEREKIKAALEQGSKAFSVYFRSELRKALDSGKGHFGTKDTAKTVVDFVADALIAANIGDVTEWREKVECAKRILQISTLPNGTTDLSYFEYKGERIQDIARQRDEYKHRAEIAERALENIIKQYWCDERGCNECEEKQGCIEGIRSRYIQQAEREIEEEER